jgi:DNA invertase Pin-like site-specific DNA recombinase
MLLSGLAYARSRDLGGGMAERAGLYQRVSDGTDKSVEEQNRANEEAAADHGWDTVRFSDSVSASRFGRKSRPGWAELTAAVAAGRFRYVVLWESSRGDRTLASWAAFLDACRETGTRIYVTSQDRLFDLANGYDWRALAAEGVDAAFESEKISKRSRRGVAGSVELGIPYGRIPYGYRRTYTREPGRSKPLPHQEPDPAEAPIVAEIIGRIAKDEAVSAILRDLAARGITTRAGGAWSRSSLTRLVLGGVVYLGKRRHNGSPLLDGNWPALVDEETYWRAHAVLSDPARKPEGGGIRPGRTRWLLSYVASCSVCGGPLSMRHLPRAGSGQTAYYRCVRGCVSAPVAWLDRMATVAVTGFCAGSPLYEVLTRADDREAQAARDEAAAERERLAEFESQAVSGALSADSFARIARGIERRIAVLDKRARELSAPPALRELTTDAATPEERWADIYARFCSMPLTARRSVIAAIFAPVLYPAGGNPSDRSRFKMPLK